MGKKIRYLGRYVMDNVSLGKGNFARVELATHDMTHIKVAIKVIDTRKIKEDYIRANLHREATILAQLRHPNIIRLYETLKATTLYCLVLEHCVGGELWDYIKTQEGSRLGESSARPFVRQLVSALHYLHERGVVHRDLKMENVMLDEKKKNIKMIDFGLSNVYKESNPLCTHCGSLEYAAPELFIVGKAYGPEIDVWSLGIIMYMMINGQLPFSMPYNDEYMKLRMLQHIQKGLASYHDRQMQNLTADCRNILHQLIEPNPELRIPLSELISHAWLTKNGKYPFTTHIPLPKDKHLRNQIISEMSIMLDMKKKRLDEIVRENKADEMSAMFNMLLHKKRLELGLNEGDHTMKKCASKDAVKTPDSARVPRLRSLGNKKSTADRFIPVTAIVHSREAGPMPEDVLSLRPRPSLLVNHTKLTSETTGLFNDRSLDVAPQTNHIQNHLTAASAMSQKPKDVPNGPVKCVPLSQRRVPPAKLNLTLDLSHPDYHLIPKSRAVSLSSSTDGVSGVVHESETAVHTSTTGTSLLPCTAGGGHASQHEAPSQRSTFSPEKRATRPSFLPYRSLLRRHTAHSADLETRPPDRSTGAIPKQYWHCEASRPKNCSMAPKATPEDSLIDSYSTSSAEEDRGILCPLPNTVHAEIAMQAHLLSALEEKREEPLSWSRMDPLSESRVVPPSVLTQGDDSGKLWRRTEQDSSWSQPIVSGEMASTVCGDTRLPSDNRHILPTHPGTHLPNDTRCVLVKQLSEAEADRCRKEDRVASGGCSLPSSATQLPSSATQLPSSATQLPSSATQLVHFKSSSDDVRPKAPCLPPATVRFLVPAEDSESDSSSTTLVAPSSGEMKRRAMSLSLGGLGGRGKLALPAKCVLKHGLSPSSPSYQEKHVKFCHVGAHALDVFFSPDEHSPSSLFRSVSCFSKEQGAAHRSYMLPHVGAMTPHEPSLLAPFDTVPSVKDIEDDYEYDDDDYCLISSKYELPDNLVAAPAGVSLVVNSPKRTTGVATVECAMPVCKSALTRTDDNTRPGSLSTRRQKEPVTTAHDSDTSQWQEAEQPANGSSRLVGHVTDKKTGDVSKSDTWLPLTEMPGKDAPNNVTMMETKPPEKNGMNNNGDQLGTPKKTPKKSPLRPLSWRKSISQLLHLNWPGSSHGNNNEARDTAPNRESNGVTSSTLTVSNSLNRRPSGRRKYANRWTMGLITHEPQNTVAINKCNSVRVTSGGTSTQQLKLNQGHMTASPNHKACLHKDGLKANCSENRKLLEKQTFSIDENNMQVKVEPGIKDTLDSVVLSNNVTVRVNATSKV